MIVMTGCQGAKVPRWPLKLGNIHHLSFSIFVFNRADVVSLILDSVNHPCSGPALPYVRNLHSSVFW